MSAAAECGGEAVARWHVEDCGRHDLSALGRRDRHRELGIAMQEVRRPIERIDDEGHIRARRRIGRELLAQNRRVWIRGLQRCPNDPLGARVDIGHEIGC